jgi:hypothetical protein
MHVAATNTAMPTRDTVGDTPAIMLEAATGAATREVMDSMAEVASAVVEVDSTGADTGNSLLRR